MGKTWSQAEEEKLVSMLRDFTYAEIGRVIGRSEGSIKKRVFRGKVDPLPFMRNVLVIGDLHAPFVKSGYLEFCKEIYRKYQCSQVVFIGDILDNHASSYHEHDPDGMGAGEELRRAREIIERFHDEFPIAKVASGNHDCYDDKTEILTRDGWIMGVDLKPGVEVGTMSLSNGAFEWQTPTDIIKKQYNGQLVSIKNKQNISLLVTPTHRIICTPNSRKANKRCYDISLASKLSNGRRYIPVSCENKNKGIDLLDNEIRLIAWIASDGSIFDNGGRFMLYQSKISGIQKIESIFSDLSIDYRKKIRIRDIKEIRGKKLKSPSLPSAEYSFHSDKIGNIYQNKYQLPRILWEMNERQFNIFIESFIDGNGSRKYDKNGKAKPGCMIYGTKEVIDQLQSLCVSNNCSSSISEYRPGDFRLNITKGRKNCAAIMTENARIDYNGYVWCASVPNTTLVIRRNGKAFISGNCIPDRKRFTAGLSASWIKSISEVLDVPGWQFAEDWLIDGVLYTHGIGRKAKQRCIQEFTSVVQGHYHSESYYETFVSEEKLLFALQIGCGVDRRSYAMAYGKHFKKPQINVGVVMDSGRWGLIEHMKL